MYEYFVWISNLRDPTNIVEYLNSLGSERWKLVSVIPSSTGTDKYYYFVRALVPSVLVETTHDDTAESRVLS